jgi:hypothetical protein
MMLRRRTSRPSPGGEVSFCEVLDLPREEAFRLLRDELPAIAAHIRDVSSITVLERSEDGGLVSLRNKWCGDARIPLVARPFIKPELLSWVDENEWSEEDWTCRWRFLAPAPFTDAVDCRGVNHYEPLPNGRCQLRSLGSLRIDLEKIPGVPRLFHRYGREVESFLAKLASPRVAQLADGLRGYLGATRG